MAWASKSTVVPKKLWDDSGSGGGRPGSIWIVNSMDMIAFVPGHDAPKDDFFDLNSTKFFSDGVSLVKK